MAEDKKAVVVYASWKKLFDKLSDEEAGRLIKHFFSYVNDENPIAPDRTTELMFVNIEDTLKRDLKKWEKRAQRSRENGNKGGRPPINPKEPEETQQVILEPRKPDNVNVNVSDINNIMGFFNFSEFANADKQRFCYEFLKCLTINDHLENFLVQFEAYKKIKAKNPQYTHAFNKFLGTQKQLFLDGAWNFENWVEKLKSAEIKEKPKFTPNINPMN